MALNTCFPLAQLFAFIFRLSSECVDGFPNHPNRGVCRVNADAAKYCLEMVRSDNFIYLFVVGRLTCPMRSFNTRESIFELAILAANECRKR